MTHHTDLAGTDDLIADAQRDLGVILRELYVPHAAELSQSEQARNVFVQLIVRTRRNEAEREAIRKLAEMVGELAKGVIVRALIRRVQRECMLPPERRAHPLPAGVATPVPDDDGTPTPVRPPPVLAHEEYAHDARPTHPLTPKPTQGPWTRDLGPKRGKR